jgi:transposase InsO family protein
MNQPKPHYPPFGLLRPRGGQCAAVLRTRATPVVPSRCRRKSISCELGLARCGRPRKTLKRSDALAAWTSQSRTTRPSVFSQAIQKRGLPRALITDNGPAMVADEVTQGLLRLGIVHERTLPYSPYQNGKQEAFWGTVEGRLLAMLDAYSEL